jgi:predicted RNase H-like HicB family nuclease
MTREYRAIVERGENGQLVAFVPGLRGGHAQAATLDDLRANLTEVVALCRAESGEDGDFRLELVVVDRD